MATKGFSDAFKQARSNMGSDGIFTYNGKKYTTRTKEEDTFYKENKGTGEAIDANRNLKRNLDAANKVDNGLPSNEATTKKKLNKKAFGGEVNEEKSVFDIIRDNVIMNRQRK